MAEPRSPSEKQAAQAAPGQTAGRAQGTPAQPSAPAARGTAPAAPPARQAPPPVAKGAPPAHLTIEPVASPTNDGAILVDWQAVELGSNRSYGCSVTSADGRGLTVSIEQGPYQRTLQGLGVVAVAAIPPAQEGTPGRLVARHDASGAVAEFTWRWTAQRVSPPPRDSAPPPQRGFWRRLFGDRGSAPPTDATAPPESPFFSNAAAPAAEPEAQSPPAATPAQEAKAATPRQAEAALPAGAAATTFFGQRAVGRRFAFVLDFSGSMSGPRWAACRSELETAFRTLPQHAECFVIAFCSRCTEPPGQAGWMVLGQNRGAETLAWMHRIHPWGTTRPGPAFERVFNLALPPDVIFFLTDGELEDFGVEDCLRLRGSRRTVVHTIALDGDGSAGTLQRIAESTGGRYAQVACALAKDRTSPPSPPPLSI